MHLIDEPDPVDKYILSSLTDLFLVWRVSKLGGSQTLMIRANLQPPSIEPFKQIAAVSLT
jgi:hypothetical protein